MLRQPVHDIRRTLSYLRHHGVRETVREVREAMEVRLGRRFDGLHQVETTDYVKLSHLGFGAEDVARSRDYRATPVRTLRALLSRLPREAMRSATFVDFGSGKGRALLVASEFPFRGIVGVEFSSELHAIAEKNIRAYRGRSQRCFHLTSIQVRAEDFVLPGGDLVLYFFNPFEQDVMEAVLGNALRAWREGSRTLYVVFLRMRFRPLVARLGVFREITSGSLPFDLARAPGCDAAIFVAEVRGEHGP